MLIKINKILLDQIHIKYIIIKKVLKPLIDYINNLKIKIKIINYQDKSIVVRKDKILSRRIKDLEEFQEEILHKIYQKRILLINLINLLMQSVNN